MALNRTSPSRIKPVSVFRLSSCEGPLLPLFSSGVVALEFAALGDISGLPDDAAAFIARVRVCNPELAARDQQSVGHAFHRFVFRAAAGDLVAVLSRGDMLVHVGVLQSAYRHDPGGAPSFPHRRDVSWLGQIRASELPPQTIGDLEKSIPFRELSFGRAAVKRAVGVELSATDGGDDLTPDEEAPREDFAVEWPSGATIPISTTDELTRKLVSLGSHIRGPRSRWRFAWRGHGDASWPLHSSLFRELRDSLNKLPTTQELAVYEARILDEARRWHLYRHATGPLTVLEEFAALQHFGVPTRLIDFTFNAFVAAWFAVEDESLDGADAALVGVDVSACEQAPGQKTWSDSSGIPPWTQMADGILCWTPPNFDYRVARQQSCFLYGPVPADPSTRRYASIPLTLGDWSAARAFELKPGKGRYPARPVIVLKISNRAKPGIRRFLRTILDLEARSIFGDLPGFATARIDAVKGRLERV